MNKDNKRHISSLENGENNIEDKLDVFGGDGWITDEEFNKKDSLNEGKCWYCNNMVEKVSKDTYRCTFCGQLFTIV